MANDHQRRVYDSIVGLQCNEENPSPLVRLNRVVSFEHTQVFAKLEWFNPFGAIKDRVAANLLREAEEQGLLQPGKKLVEATSGNTGLGLAMLGNAIGYSLRTPLSKGIPIEKRTVLRFFGTEVVELDDTLCPAPGAPEGAIAQARSTSETEDEFVFLDQYSNQANPGGHYRTTGPEIWRQTDGKITHFVAGLGTCGTIKGTGRFLKEKNKEVQVIGVHPEDGHDIPGVRSQRQLSQTSFYHPEEYDGETEVTNRDAYNMCLRLNREESIIAGPSSGMSLVGALRLIPDEPGNLVVVIFPDDIFKYASSLLRHFPELRPADEGSQEKGPSKGDLMLSEMMENLKNPHDSIRAKDLNDRIQQTENPLVIDIRIPGDFADAHILGSVNIPQKEISDRRSELPEDRDASIVTVCNIGKFSKEATLYLKSMGYRNVRSLKGGLNEWVRKKFETHSDKAETLS